MVKEEKSFILLVDDNPKNLQLLGSILEGEYKTVIAMNGLEAMKIAEKKLPDLILLDIMMPGIDGFEVCKKLKQKPETESIPIIFLTAKIETEDIVKGFKVGASDYISKPFKKEELLARVNNHLEIKSSREIIKKQNCEQKELLHVLCHDLMNPLYAISSFMEITDTVEEFNDVKKYLSMAANQGIEIIELVRKMRSLEEYSIKLSSINLYNAIRNSEYILRKRLNDKDIDLEIDIAKDINVLAEESSFINSVLNNILTNSIKFSFPNSNIFIKAIKANDLIELTVKDNGIGMPEEILEDIFKIGKRTNRNGTQGEMGTGFGMPLVKKFVNIYGGDIKILSTEDEYDHGTKVIITLKTD